MRISLLLTLVLLSTNNLKAQKVNDSTSTTSKSFQYYMQKHNTNKTIGWVCLGTGLTMGAVSFVALIGTALSGDPKGTGLGNVGTFTALASIPFFVIAHRNKKKASLALNSNAVTNDGFKLYKNNYTQLSLAVHF
jgi:hypothetical protein